ncbi:MAG: RNA methyltransferase [Clostridia bacterium]|nr:RNA methyltransferase [Clostridia bacterium]
MTVEGAISVKAVLLSGSRPIEEIYIDKTKKSKDFSFIIREAEKRGVKTVFLDSDGISEIVNGRTHGGVAATVGERKYISCGELFAVENPFIALLEGIEDPYNFGDALRSFYAAGATGLIVPARNWLDSAATVVKSSAGASELLPTACCEDLSAAVIEAKKYGIKTFCAERRDARPLYGTDLTCPLIIAIGGELRGLSRKITDNADGNIYIPYGSQFKNALSASGASAVFAFETMRQRNKKSDG